jgi:hypothetical protein
MIFSRLGMNRHKYAKARENRKWRRCCAISIHRLSEGSQMMFRAFFLAIGFFLMLFGVECLGVERMNLKMRESPPAPVGPFDFEVKEGAQKQLTPPAWAPWSLLSTGAVMCLYSFTIPKRVAGG